MCFRCWQVINGGGAKAKIGAKPIGPLYKGFVVIIIRYSEGEGAGLKKNSNSVKTILLKLR